MFQKSAATATRSFFVAVQRRLQSTSALPQTYWRDQISQRIAQSGGQPQPMSVATKTPELAMSQWQDLVKSSNKIVAEAVVEPRVVVKAKAQPASM
eukprot:CAMPEP_0196719658 /NCGR_PEP_ID=MMETSP1091-20130531/2594_1 /TAXON_ID=302021 /ORGANISM="Rhodomonas sp., Strain CCMP768" /LENGTH=95 /DNA_ID=CAMNT_0042060679 /DNA_START=69 /DNA_END=356 /DNA_ORIENTATION=-